MAGVAELNVSAKATGSDRAAGSAPASSGSTPAPSDGAAEEAGAGEIDEKERAEKKRPLITERLGDQLVETRLKELSPSEREAARPRIEAEVRAQLAEQASQDAIGLSVLVDDLFDAKTRVQRGGTLDRAEQERVALAAELKASSQSPASTDEEEIVVTGWRSDAARIKAGELGIIEKTGRLVEPITPHGGGMVQGTGTGLVNNARDTVGLIADGAGYLINKAIGGYTYKDAAARTEGRIVGAAALGAAVIADPRGTAARLGSDYLQPFTEGANQLRAGQAYEGTAKISEAGSDLILSAAGGGSKLVIGAITGGKLPGIDYDSISTAKPHQAVAPRDLPEQVLWNRILADPASGNSLGLTGDARFPTSDGWSKMGAVHTLPDGSKIDIHYQFNSRTGKVVDMKIVTPKRTTLQPGPSIRR